MPLYQREWALEQQLNSVKWAALSDTLKGLALAFAPSADTGPGDLAANNSAARAGTPGYQFKGENAATSAQEPAETPKSMKAAMNLVNQIQATEDAISRVQKSYGIASNARTPWSILFPSGNKTLTPAEVTKLLEPAAKRFTDAQEPPMTQARLDGERVRREAERDQCGKSHQTCISGCVNPVPTSGDVMITCLNTCKARLDSCLAPIDTANQKTIKH